MNVSCGSFGNKGSLLVLELFFKVLRWVTICQFVFIRCIPPYTAIMVAVQFCFLRGLKHMSCNRQQKYLIKRRSLLLVLDGGISPSFREEKRTSVQNIVSQVRTRLKLWEHSTDYRLAGRNFYFWQTFYTKRRNLEICWYSFRFLRGHIVSCVSVWQGDYIFFGFQPKRFASIRNLQKLVVSKFAISTAIY